MNTANGLVKLDANTKLPTSLYDTMVYTRETVTNNTIVVSNTYKTYYWTAVSGATLTINWGTYTSNDVSLWLKITMPSTVVSFSFPTDITVWLDDFGNVSSAIDMSTSGTYWIFIHKDANTVYATGRKVS